jgi:hypothetical protein
LSHQDSLTFHEYIQRYPSLGSNVNWILSSPNAAWIPHPPPATRSLCLRTDGRFGLDDPLNWPQPCQANFEYLACIPNASHSTCSRFWHTPLTTDDCIAVDGSPGIFKLSRQKLEAMSPVHTQLCRRRTTFTGSVSGRLSGPIQPLFQYFNRAHQLVVESLEDEACLALRWATMARWALELTAYIDYYTVFLPRLQKTGTFAPDPTRVGCLSLTSELTMECHKMGIPVWHLRPASSPYLRSSKMMLKTEPVSVPSFVDLVPAAGHVAILTVDFWSDKYLGPIHEWARLTPLAGAVKNVEPPISSSTRPRKRKRPTNHLDDAPRKSKTCANGLCFRRLIPPFANLCFARQEDNPRSHNHQ